MDTGLRWVSPRDSATITRSVALSESYFFRLSVQSTQSRNQSRSVPRCPSRPASRGGSRHPAGRSLSTSAGRTPCQLLSRVFFRKFQYSGDRYLLLLFAGLRMVHSRRRCNPPSVAECRDVDNYDIPGPHITPPPPEPNILRLNCVEITGIACQRGDKLNAQTAECSLVYLSCLVSFCAKLLPR